MGFVHKVPSVFTLLLRSSALHREIRLTSAVAFSGCPASRPLLLHGLAGTSHLSRHPAPRLSLSFQHPSVGVSTGSSHLRASKDAAAEGANSAAGVSQTEDDGRDKPSAPDGGESSKKVSLFQRFKNAYKEYGKVLIGVHLATSVVWFGSFYYVARSGLDIAPLLQAVGVSSAIISKVTDSAAGDLAVAYVLYELTKPIRFAVTLVGTQHTVRKLRQWGYMEPRKDEDRLRTLAREGREQLQEKRVAITERMRQRAGRRLVFRRRMSAGRSTRQPTDSTTASTDGAAGPVTPTPTTGSAAVQTDRDPGNGSRIRSTTKNPAKAGDSGSSAL